MQPIARPSARLSRSVQVVGLAVTLALAIGAVLLIARGGERQARGETALFLTSAARRTANLVAESVTERQKESELLATLPDLIVLTGEAELRTTTEKLSGLDTTTLGTKYPFGMLAPAPAIRIFLARAAARSGFTGLLVTESHGLVVTTPYEAAPFDRSAAPWFVGAKRGATWVGPPLIDSDRGQAAIEFAVPMRMSGRDDAIGILRTEYPLDRIGSRIARDIGADSNTTVQLVGANGMVLYSSDKPMRVATTWPDTAILADTALHIVQVHDSAGRGRLAVATVPGLGWKVLVRRPEQSTWAVVTHIDRNTMTEGTLFVALLVGALVGLVWWLRKEVTRPIVRLERVASRVAGGELAEWAAADTSGAGEVGELAIAVRQMVAALRGLVGRIQTSSTEAADLAHQTSAATEQMSASTEEVAATCGDLVRRASDQAELARGAAEDATRVQEIASRLAHGAGQAATRSAGLVTLASTHRDRLEGSSAELDRLAHEIERAAEESQVLARTSAAISQFAAQARTIASQTHLLALNASIEAARAGEHGRGFAVVAEEVRNLASQAENGAARTDEVVHQVIEQVEATRKRLLRLTESGATARDVARTAALGLQGVADEAKAADAWSQEVSVAAAQVSGLVDGMSTALASVRAGAIDTASSAEEIAATTEQLTGSTEEVAQTAHRLEQAANDLLGAVVQFRMSPTAPPAETPSGPPSSSLSIPGSMLAGIPIFRRRGIRVAAGAS